MYKKKKEQKDVVSSSSAGNTPWLRLPLESLLRCSPVWFDEMICSNTKSLRTVLWASYQT